MVNTLHGRVFDFLENYRKSHPDFFYWLRERNTKNRLDEGYWFQGTENYAFVGLYNRGGGTNMTRSFGLVFIDKPNGKIYCHLEVVFNEETDTNILHFYNKAMEMLNGFEQQHKTKFYKVLSKENGFEAAKDFLNNEKPKVDNLIHELGLTQLFITEDAFQQKFQRVLSFRQAGKILSSEINTKTFMTNAPLNQILYGPPGTGKTYHTVNKAVAIANPAFAFDGKSRLEIKAEYNRLKANEQIEFITFHQSMTYEDFIEGIKPVEPEPGDPFLKYKVQDGIFKKMVERASYTPESKIFRFSLEPTQYEQASFYKLNLHNPGQPDKEDAYAYCLTNNCIAMGWGGATNFAGKTESELTKMVQDGVLQQEASLALNSFIHLLKVGNYVLLAKDNHVIAIGLVTSNYYYNDQATPGYYHYRQVDWQVKNVHIPAEEIYHKSFGPRTMYRLDKEEIKKDFFVKSAVQINPIIEKRNYVLIIDEINRGNVSAIFGELITLIEEDKRQGKEEALEVMLPYSKDKFSVPANLYIIGTMNTADRSVEALDTALRRRFVFEEMLPEPSLLSPQRMLWNLWWDYEDLEWSEEKYSKKENELYQFIGLPEEFGHDDKLWTPMVVEGKQESQITVFDTAPFTGLNLQSMLTTINQRLVALLTKDHVIGHAWLMNVYSLDDLQLAFKNKILPLLQEYFYNNYAKIGLVLGDQFFEEPLKVDKALFAKFKNGDDIAEDYNDKMIYRFKDTKELTIADFKTIYE